MKWFALIILIILIILTVLFFTSIKIRIEYKRRKENDRIQIELSAWWDTVKIKYDIPMLQIQSLIKGVGVKEKTQAGTTATPLPKKRFRFTPREFRYYLDLWLNFRKQVHDLNEITKILLKHIRCEKLEWYTKVGVGDAAVTGVLTGVVWSIQSLLVGLISHYITLRTAPKMGVVPDFHGQDINTQLNCILRFRLGNIIIAGTRILFKIRKGREGLWQNTLFRA